MKCQPYKRYRASSSLWLSNVPEHWGVLPLKHCVARFTAGGTPKTDEAEYWAEAEEEGVPWVSIGDMSTTRQVRSTAKRVTRKGLAAAGLRLLKPGTILYAMYASLGKVAQLEVPAVTNQAILGLTENGTTDRDFLYWYLSFLEDRVKEVAASNTQDNLNAEKVRQLPVCLPPLPEQRAIAAFLERETARIDTLAEKKRQLIELLQQKRAAAITQAVIRGLGVLQTGLTDSGIQWLGKIPSGWAVMSLARITTKLTNGYVGPTRDMFFDEGIPYLQSLHIKQNRIEFGNDYFVAPEWSKRHAKSVLREGDVLVVQTGDIGQVAYVPKAWEGANCHALIICSPNPLYIEGQFLAWVLTSDFGQALLLSSQTGALHPHLNCGVIKHLQLPVPPLAEQRSIVEHVTGAVERMRRLEDKTEEVIDLLVEERAALIAAAITGQIDVREAA